MEFEVIKDFPGVSVGDVFVFDENSQQYYLEGDNTTQYFTEEYLLENEEYFRLIDADLSETEETEEENETSDLYIENQIFDTMSLANFENIANRLKAIFINGEQ